jgi:CHAT domain-containing protein/tetratricopeptide (TPR) repeat protein
MTKKLKLAEENAKAAIAALEKPGVSDTSALVRTWSTLGNALAEMGRLGESLDALRRALAMEESRARPDSVVMAAQLRNLGRTYRLAGDQAATEAFERAAGIQERVLGGDHPELATTLYFLSFSNLEAGEFLESRRNAERAVSIREKVYGPDHPQVAVALWQLAGAERELGDPERAIALLERSVQILRTSPLAAPADLATALSNLGTNRLSVGDGRGAHAAYDEAMAIRAKVFGPGSGRGFYAMTRLGEAMVLEGRSREAEALFDTLLASPGQRSPFDLADAQQRAGVAACANGSLDKAERHFDRAFAIHDSLLGIGSPRTFESLSKRAAVRWAQGRRADALADARRFESATTEFVRSTARGLSEHEALGFDAHRAPGRDLLIELATDSTGLDEADRAAVFDAVVRSRLAVLDELADESRALPRDDAALAPLVKELEDARAALSQQMVRALREERPPDSAAAAAVARRERAERALAEKSGSFRAITRRASAGGAEVAAALPRGSVLISYVRYHTPRRILDAGTPAAKTAPTSQYAALLLRPGHTAPAVVSLGAAVELEPMVLRWNAALATPPPATPAGGAAAQRRCDAIGRAIRAQIWDPVAKHLEGVERVFVVPDGVLHAVNLLALPDTNGFYLAESGPVIHRLTAERDLLPWDPSTPRGQGLLAIGGADFDRAGAAAPAAGEPIAMADVPSRVRSAIPDSLRIRFEPLPGTAAEIDEVGRLWKKSASLGESIELKGAEASEAEFKQQAAGRRVLHLATHGFALGARRPVREGTRGIGGVGSGERPAAKHAAPLLPGLALAGANAAAPAGGEDGFLTAEEITALDLSSVDWAVLSACETGISDPDAVEAVQGLHRSFRRAGARTVIMSLWAVDDATTLAWMKSLYEARFLKKLDTATAVREACRARLAERRAAMLDTHPFRWAAFVASGDWR